MSLKVSSAPIGTMFCVIGRGTGQSRSTFMTCFPYPHLPFFFPWQDTDWRHCSHGQMFPHWKLKGPYLVLDIPASIHSEKFVSVVYITLPVMYFFFSATLFPLRCAKRSLSERPAKPVVVLCRIPAKTVFTFPLLIRSIAELGDNGGQLLSGLECCLKVSTLSEGSRSHWTTLSEFWLAKAIPMFSIQFLVSQPEKYE